MIPPLGEPQTSMELKFRVWGLVRVYVQGLGFRRASGVQGAEVSSMNNINIIINNNTNTNNNNNNNNSPYGCR